MHRGGKDGWNGIIIVAVSDGEREEEEDERECENLVDERELLRNAGRIKDL